MPQTYPPDLEIFIRRELASGEYANEDELICEAIKVLRELKSRHQELRAEIQLAISQAERGEVAIFDAAEFKKEARRRLAEQG